MTHKSTFTYVIVLSEGEGIEAFALFFCPLPSWGLSSFHPTLYSQRIIQVYGTHIERGGGHNERIR